MGRKKKKDRENMKKDMRYWISFVERLCDTDQAGWSRTEESSMMSTCGYSKRFCMQTWRKMTAVRLDPQRAWASVLQFSIERDLKSGKEQISQREKGCGVPTDKRYWDVLLVETQPVTRVSKITDRNWRRPTFTGKWLCEGKEKTNSTQSKWVFSRSSHCGGAGLLLQASLL